MSHFCKLGMWLLMRVYIQAIRKTMRGTSRSFHPIIDRTNLFSFGIKNIAGFTRFIFHRKNQIATGIVERLFVLANFPHFFPVGIRQRAIRIQEGDFFSPEHPE